MAKVPDHPAGEHPMFKAMAAANGKHDDPTRTRATTKTPAEDVAEVDRRPSARPSVEAADEELEDDFDESDEDESDDDDDESDEDEIDLDADDEDEDDDDIEVIDDDSDEDSDEDRLRR